MVPSAFGLLMLVGSGWGGTGSIALLMLALSSTVGLHRVVCGSATTTVCLAGPRRLRTPGQVAAAVVVAVGAGAVLAVVLSMVLAAVASPVVGDGSLLVRLLLVVCVLGPCISIGSRCGHWWAFVGAASVVPILGWSMLVAGPRSRNGVEFIAAVAIATAFALSAGSLRSQLATAARDQGRRRKRARLPAVARERGVRPPRAADTRPFGHSHARTARSSH